MSKIGVIAIGRNEGERLRRCLSSLDTARDTTVYVDSGSSDESVSFTRSLGVDVVELDLSIPFTAARARNAGLERLLQRAPDIEFVQFVDGDCEVAPGWLGLASQQLESRPDVGVVCGRRRERYPGQSTYNRLCDLEWDTPIGEAKACGGDAMFRADVLRQVGGFNPAMIAGEEPELCFRIREAGSKVWRLDAEMTLHDAAITRFGQWWKRTVRAGHAFAEGAWLHGHSPERYSVKPTCSILFWAVLIPLVALLTAWPTHGLSLLLLFAYAWLGWRIMRWQRRIGRPPADSRAYAAFTVVGKFAEASGVLRFYWGLIAGRRSRIIEYKGNHPPSAASTI
jgi:GT2 family glycosyltransferase